MDGLLVNKAASFLASLLCACWMAPIAASAAPPVVVAGAQGRIEGASEPIPLAFTGTGRVTRILVAEGATVVKGQPLAELECIAERARTDEAGAALASMRQAFNRAERGARPEERAVAAALELSAAADLKDAEVEFDRVRSLMNRGEFASKRDVDQAQHRLDVAKAKMDASRHSREFVNVGLLPEERSRWRADVEAAEAHLREAQDMVAQCTIRSPTDGIMIRRVILAGEVVSQLAPRTALWVIDRSKTRVRAEIDERDFARIAVGQAALVSAGPESSPTYLGVVSWLSPAMGRRTVRGTDPAEKADRDVLECLVDLSDAARPLPVGLRVSVRFMALSH